jgi:hypothetical protein
MTTRSEALAARLEQGARALADFARELTEEEWQTPILPDGRKAGVIVHHASQFVLEDHAVRHSYHHLARIRRSLSEGLRSGRAERAAAGR